MQVLTLSLTQNGDFAVSLRKIINLLFLRGPCGLRDCKNRPAPFPGRMSYKATKPGLALSIVYLSMHYIVLLFTKAPFYVLLVFVGMRCLLDVIVKSSLLAN